MVTLHQAGKEFKRREREMGSQYGIHAVMFPWFAFGHISPFIQLSNKLANHGIRISFFSAPANIPRIQKTLNTDNPLIQIVPLTIPHVDGLPPGQESTADLAPDTAELLKFALDSMQDQIETQLAKLSPNFVFHDFTHHWLPPIATKLGIKSLFFSVFTAISGAYVMVPSRKAGGINPTKEDLEKRPPGFPNTIAGLKTYEAKDFLYVFKTFNNSPYGVYDRVVTCMNNSTAIVIKTCTEMEACYCEFIETQYRKPILLAGPVVPEPPTGVLEEKWTKWLGGFPARSVVFCSFGSETFLTDDQIRELVCGLELSGLPFMVVLNFPASENSEKRLASALPDGFLEKVLGRGIITTGWVQQQLILAHDSVGCFVCHSGFSSLVEAVMSNCQLVMLPQKGDQFLNSKLMAGDLKVGIEIERREEDGFYGKEDVCRAVKSVMVNVEEEPGRQVRGNHGKLREFLLDKDVHSNYIKNFVRKLLDLAAAN